MGEKIVAGRNCRIAGPGTFRAASSASHNRFAAGEALHGFLQAQYGSKFCIWGIMGQIAWRGL